MFLPFALAMTTLFLVARVIIARGTAIRLFTSNVAFGRTFLDLGFVRIGTRSGMSSGIIVTRTIAAIRRTSTSSSCGRRIVITLF